MPLVPHMSVTSVIVTQTGWYPFTCTCMYALLTHLLYFFKIKKVYHSGKDKAMSTLAMFTVLSFFERGISRKIQMQYKNVLCSICLLGWSVGKCNHPQAIFTSQEETAADCRGCTCPACLSNDNFVLHLVQESYISGMAALFCGSAIFWCMTARSYLSHLSYKCIPHLNAYWGHTSLRQLQSLLTLRMKLSEILAYAHHINSSKPKCTL